MSYGPFVFRYCTKLAQFAQLAKLAQFVFVLSSLLEEIFAESAAFHKLFLFGAQKLVHEVPLLLTQRDHEVRKVFCVCKVQICPIGQISQIGGDIHVFSKRSDAQSPPVSLFPNRQAPKPQKILVIFGKLGIRASAHAPKGKVACRGKFFGAFCDILLP